MIPLAAIAALLLASAVFAFTRRNLIHAALLLILTWAGVASFYLWAGAEFVAFAQVLIYVGAVSMVVLFTVLLTRRTLDDVPAEDTGKTGSRRRTLVAVATGLILATVLAGAVFATTFAAPAPTAPALSVRLIGWQLMGRHAAALLIAGVILTVALIGATVLAAQDQPEDGP